MALQSHGFTHSRHLIAALLCIATAPGMFPYRDLDEAVQQTDSGVGELFDFCTGANDQHGMTALLSPVDRYEPNGSSGSRFTTTTSI